MKPITADQIRASLVNAGPDVAAEMTMPGLHEILWEHRDFLGWRDAKFPQRAYISYWRTPPAFADDAVDGSPHSDLITIVLRAPSGTPRSDRLGICALCGTQQPTRVVRLFTAPKAGPSGENGSTVGNYLCDDLSCSLTIRNATPHDLQSDFGAYTWRRIERLRARLDGFVGHVLVP